MAESLEVVSKQAAIEYLKLRNREINPAGTFDRAGRFWPTETFDCCSKVRGPTRRWPYSLMTHCRTKRHVAKKYGIQIEDINMWIRRLEW